MRESSEFQHVCDTLSESSVMDSDRVQLLRKIEEFYSFSKLINRTRRRDIGNFTTRKPQTVEVEFTQSQRKLYDAHLEAVAKMLALSHGDTNIKFMMTTLRRQAASCLYGLAPLMEDMLSGKFDSLELPKPPTATLICQLWVSQSLLLFPVLLNYAERLIHSIQKQTPYSKLFPKSNLQ